MFCEHCGAQNPETASYCRACGKRMEGKRENQAHHHIFQGTILFLAGPLTGRSFPITPPATTLGRDPRNTIVIPDPAVSPFHARLVLTGSGWVIELLALQNTLMVNQTQTRQQLIRDQDTIGLGPGAVFRCAVQMGMPQYPQHLRYGPLLSRRTILMSGAALAGAFLLVAGCGSSGLSPTPTPSDLGPTPGTSVSSPSSSSPQPQPFQHVALGTHLLTYKEQQAGVLTVAWSPNNAYIASGAGEPDSTVKVWNALDGTTVYTYQKYAIGNTILSKWAQSLAWSPDGTRLVTCDGGDVAEVQTWNATDGGQDTELKIPSTANVIGTNQVAWSHSGTRIAAACGSVDLKTGNTSTGTVLLWDAGSSEPLPYYTTQSVVDSVAWSPDSQRIASGSWDNTVQVLSVGSWQTLFSYQGHTSTVSTVAWSPDGRYVASASLDRTVQVWDATNGNALSTFRGHTDVVRTVTWSPDSQRLASGGDDGTVQIWNAADASPIYMYKGHSDKVNQVAWSPDGTRIASASNDQTAQVWGAG